MRDWSERARQTIVVLDDDAEYRDGCKHDLAPRDVITVLTTEEARAALASRDVDVLLVDLWLDPPDRTLKKPKRTAWGIDIIAELRPLYPDLDIILASSGATLAFADEALLRGADATVPKQHFSPRHIIRLLEAGRILELVDSCTPHGTMSLARHEREYVAKVYLENARNVSRTAAALGVERNTVYEKLRTWRG